MEFDVYCDESYPDLFTSERPQARFLVIGGLWLRTSDRDSLKQTIHVLREQHKIGGEFKWGKVSSSRLAFYTDLIDFFFGQGKKLRFRCIVVDSQRVDLVRFHEGDQELGFYKFYYQMLHHWISDFNDYSIFCDFKANRIPSRLHTLKRCLDCTNLSASIKNVQAVRSDESVLVQLADVLTGATASRINEKLRSNSAKAQLVETIEARLGHKVWPTVRSENKFNVFKISLDGGW